MRRRALPPDVARRGDFRDGSGKFRCGFMCANAHNGYLCNADHITRRRGVASGRMERGCHIKKLSSVKATEVYPRAHTRKDGIYEYQNWRSHPRAVCINHDDVFRLCPRQN
ncbi:hypothetical protein HMPREF0880_00140 [Yokenella regensburgei ATCC 43003]|nr:hypothetical protein HMPREF0880_00140 [Yokenella regensburgei ATCC 43003]